MSALADALTAAQTRAVAALGKQYRAGLVEQESAVAWLESFGLDDRVDMGRWFSCLDARAMLDELLPYPEEES